MPVFCVSPGAILMKNSKLSCKRQRQIGIRAFAKYKKLAGVEVRFTEEQRKAFKTDNNAIVKIFSFLSPEHKKAALTEFLCHIDILGSEGKEIVDLLYRLEADKIDPMSLKLLNFLSRSRDLTADVLIEETDAVHWSDIVPFLYKTEIVAEVYSELVEVAEELTREKFLQKAKEKLQLGDPVEELRKTMWKMDFLAEDHAIDSLSFRPV